MDSEFSQDDPSPTDDQLPPEAGDEVGPEAPAEPPTERFLDGYVPI